MVQVAGLKDSLEQVSRLEKPLKDLLVLQEPLNKISKEGRPLSFIGSLSDASLAGLIIGVVAAFFLLLFITVFAAVRLGSKPRTTFVPVPQGT